MQRCGGDGIGAVALTEVLQTRRAGLAEHETWALLCQAVQALQDLFLSDSGNVGRCFPLVTPDTLLMTSRGRVMLPESRRCTGATARTVFLAPEYRTGKIFSDTECEKMWIYSLGETLTSAALVGPTRNGCASPLSPLLCRALGAMTRRPPARRATLMYLLDIISEYCQSSLQTKPLSHIVMDLYNEVRGSCAQHPIQQLQKHHRRPELDPELLLNRNPLEPRSISEVTDSNPQPTISNISREPKTTTQSHPDHNSHWQSNERRRTEHHNEVDSTERRDFRNRPRNPVQRSASRLYRLDEKSRPSTHTRGCIGPEFVVRANLPSKCLSIGENVKPQLRKTVTVILLDGQKLDISCDPNSTTAGQIFETVIQSQNLKDNFMLGLSALMSGDFIFLPSDTKVSKVVNSSSWTNLTLFLRVRLFLPSLRGMRGFEARHILYLQLRRSILEQQLPCSVKTAIMLAGLALQAEFGDFKDQEHGTTDYFLLEHYLPEIMLNDTTEQPLRKSLTKAHIERYEMSRDRAEQTFIQHAQALPHYGSHFYAAVWVTKESQENVWLCVTARGISIYDRLANPPAASSKPCQAFEWRSIQTLCYSKYFLCILPHTGGKHSKPSKCKLKMDHRKSYFTFRLASLQHQFFLRLRTEYTSLQSLAQEFGVPLKDVKNETNTLCKINPISNSRDTQFKISFRASSTSSHESDSVKAKCRRSKSATEIRISDNNMQLEEYQNKENENPQKHFGSLSRDVRNALILESSYLSGVPNVPSFSKERRNGVLMGTRAIGTMGTLNLTLNDSHAHSDDLEKLSLQSVSLNCGSDRHSSSPEAYVLNSSIKSADKFLPDFQETVSDSLLEKFDQMSYTEERLLRTVTIVRNVVGSLGLQVTEGSDGNVYVQTVIPNGPADITNAIFQGDQIVGVDGQNLLNLPYVEALKVFKKTGRNVEFIVSRITSRNQSIVKKPQKCTKKSTDLYKSCLNLNHTNTVSNSMKQTAKSCSDISYLGLDALDCSIMNRSNIKNDCINNISLLNFVDFSRTLNETQTRIPDSNVRKSASVKSTPTKIPVETSYLKHIRYESNAKINGIGDVSKISDDSISNLRTTKSCGTLNDPRLYISEENLDNTLKYTSCKNLNENIKQNQSSVVIVDMIPKISQKFEDFLYSHSEMHNQNDKINSNEYQDNSQDSQNKFKKIPLPRSLGLGRKWIGPVKYPVTPAKVIACGGSVNISEEEATSTSDDEQIFI